MRSADNRLVLVGARLGINAALLVSRMLGLRNPREFQPVPADAADVFAVAPWAGQVWHDGGNSSGTMLRMRSWRELKLEQLVEDPGFLNVGA